MERKVTKKVKVCVMSMLCIVFFLITDFSIAQEKVSYSFQEVEEKPYFKECENISNEDQDKCFKKQLVAHISKNIQYPEEALKKDIGGRVFVKFLIDKQGSVKVEEIRGVNNELLRDEAKRVIETLPQMIPGKNNGEIVEVSYIYPITFQVPNPPIHIDLGKYSKKLSDSMQIPNFKECEGIPRDLEFLCFKKNLDKYIAEGLLSPKLKSDVEKLEGKVYILFIIDKEGKVYVKDAKGNNESLKKVAIEIISSLPQMNPGKKDGEVKDVSFSYPIVFKLPEPKPKPQRRPNNGWR